MKRERTVLDHGVIQRQRAVAHLQPLLLDFLGELLDAEFVHQDLDARLVDVVAAAVLVVDAQDRLDIAQEIAAVHERLDRLGDERRAAEAAADQHLEPGLAFGVLVQAQADVVDLDRGAIMRGGGDRELELARQEGEFRMQRGVLPQQFGPDAGILDLAGRHAGPLVRGDVAGVVARGLHGVDADLGEIGQRIRQFGELDPVELDVLPRGEMAVAAVVAPRDMRQRAQLLRRQRAVGDRDAEHIGVQLQIDAVLQPQHLEFVLGELAGQPALHLIAKFRDALVDERAIEFVICVHDWKPYAGTGRPMVTPCEPDMFAQIAGLDLAAVLDFDRRDIGADRADVVGHRFGEQRARLVGGADDRGIRQAPPTSLAERCGRSRRRPRCGWRSPPTGR